jgi:hypothetical protein
MAVVINEFEIVPEAQPAAPGTAAQAPSAELTPRDVEAIIQRCQERYVRVRAH